MAEEEIIRKLIESLLYELNIDVDEDVKGRLTEGLMNSIRVLTLLSMLRANDFWWRLRIYPTHLYLKKSWFPVRTTDVQDVMQKDLLRLLRREIRPKKDALKIAKNLEEKYGLSEHVQRIILEQDVEKELSINSIAFEAAVLDELKRRDKRISIRDLQELEDDIGKWFG